MMKVEFFGYGHKNISSRHRNTFEITADKELTPKGDCIIAVGAEIPDLHCFLDKKKVCIRLSAGDYSETIEAIPNPEFCDRKELVVRIGEFASSRTFGLRADKVAVDFNRNMVELLKNPEQKLKIEIFDEDEKETI